MFDIREFYEKSNKGEEVNIDSFIDYLNSYNNIILWGAGNMGSAIGKKLIELGINISCYWDRNAIDIKELNGIKVLPNFSGDFDKETTLVIICIVSGALGQRWPQNSLIENDYKNYLLSMNVYEALICPFKLGDKLEHKICLNNAACAHNVCKKYINLIEKNRFDGNLVFQSVTLIISTRCTLKCTYCGQRLRSCSPEKIKDYTLEQIKHDIDAFLNSVDSVGIMYIIGGEPFVHPDIVLIVQYLLKKKNFGVLYIVSNGICKITEEMLTQLKDDRLKIVFSSYVKYLNNDQRKLFNKNVQLISRSGISFSITNSPIWVIPGKIEQNNYTIEQMISKKSSCEFGLQCSTIENGRLIPCSTTEVGRRLDVADLEMDCVDLRDTTKNLNFRIQEWLHQPYYISCKYCPTSASIQIPAGEQID